MGIVVEHDDAVARIVGDHPRDGEKTTVISVAIHGHGPQRVVVERRGGGGPSRELVAGHRVRAYIAARQTRIPHLIADHHLDTAHIGERDVLIRFEQRPQLAEDRRHRLQRVAQHDDIRLRFDQFGERAHAAYAIGFGLGVWMRTMVPRDDRHPADGEPSGQRPADQAESDDSDREPCGGRSIMTSYHSNSLRAVSPSVHVPGAAGSRRTPPLGSDHA